MVAALFLLLTHPTYLDIQSGSVVCWFSLHWVYRFDDPGCAEVRWGEVRYKHFESCSPIGLYSTELSILWTPYTSGMAGLSVVGAAAGWLASQFPVGRLSRRLVQKRASPELPGRVSSQGRLIYTTHTSCNDVALYSYLKHELLSYWKRKI